MIQGYTYKPSISNSCEQYNYVEKVLNTVQQIDDKFVIWHIQGGLGKNIAGTALVADLKNAYPDRKLIMVVSYPEIFLNNPNIHRVFPLGNSPYFYEDYIENKDSIVFRHEPYFQTGHIKMINHLIKSWCELLNLTYTGQMPQIFVNYTQKLTTSIWERDRPVLVLQTCGGPFNEQKHHYSWTRDMPIELARAIVKKYSKDYHIVQVTRPNGYFLDNVERVDKPLSNVELFALLVHSKKRMLIDSCLQHAAAAFNLPSTVFWVGTSPNVFGYSIHTNYTAKLPARANQLINSYIFNYQFDNNLHECPYMEVQDIFNIDEIMSKLN